MVATQVTFAQSAAAVTRCDDVMADDGLGDLLGDMDDLDNALFGRSTGPKTKPSLGNLDSLFGETKKPAAKKSTVSFLDTPAAATSTTPHPPTKSTLDDLFADTSAEQKPSASSTTTPATTMSRPSRHQAGSATLGSLLGPSRRDKEAKPAAAAAEPAPTPTPAAQVVAPAPEETLRAKRLENEVERLNREIEEIKRRKKEDEQDIERLWKEKLAKKDHDHQEELKDLDNAHQKQISKLQAEHSEELERLKTTYERQLDSIQQSAGQWRLLEDKAQFEDERKKVYELNSKLNELCKGQETVMEQDKYRVREEWNRLNAEKAVFKEDQRFILENIEKQKAALDRSKTAFFQEQHDLLVRVSTERQLLEQEKNEFHGKRSTDVRRLKEEAGELQRRAQNVLAAERQVDEMKKHYETKMRQARDGY
ncbi:hypothetical protein Y032_0219g2451 [Ancylostoma ceylanicum]|uniref:Uncharacterized protein n=1 Tax=Ancylostoma ceylanicum TaxID=53326 RepID=A0A016SJH5_9BILA|nr:hypothetical protein Y032_0219g2451 [Ancylostoma ceylanicum]